MELRHLRYALAVADELHFGRAAERLCIAQPPLSQQIQQLERELDFRLFERTHRRVEITAAGRLFLDEARSLMAGLERAAQAGRRVARGEAGWLGVGFVGSAAYVMLPAVLSAYRREYADVELVLRELVSGQQALALRERRIHVGLARPPVEGDGLVSEVIAREPVLAAMSSGHRLASRRRLRLAALADEPFVLFPHHVKPSYADFVREACLAAGFMPHVAQEAVEMNTALGLVAAGIGVTLVPESARHVRRDGVALVPLAGPAPVSEMALIYRQGDDAPTLQAFLRLARQAAAAVTGTAGMLAPDREE